MVTDSQVAKFSETYFQMFPFRKKTKKKQKPSSKGGQKRRSDAYFDWLIYLDGLRRESTLLVDFVDPCKTETHCENLAFAVQ